VVLLKRKDMDADHQSAAAFIRDATPNDVPQIAELIEPFVARKQILPRSIDEIGELVKNGFVAESGGNIVGFAAVEIYSKKLAELLCLAVSGPFQGRGVGRKLVDCCVERARSKDVYEVMAITADEQFFGSCGFHYILPEQKRALFIRTRD